MLSSFTDDFADYDSPKHQFEIDLVSAAQIESLTCHLPYVKTSYINRIKGCLTHFITAQTLSEISVLFSRHKNSF